MYQTNSFAGKLFAFLLFFIGLSQFVSAQVIKGKITDAKTGEPMIGASVQIEKGSVKLITSVNLDGTYTFRNLSAGRYELKVKSIGYKNSKEYDVTVVSGQPTIFNLQMQVESTELEAVKVTSAAGRETDKSARTIEKNADNVLNLLSQKAIELSPDVTVANSLQRISGVTIQRSSSGEGRYAIIRGMDQRYNNTLINGIKIPSPDDKFRYVPLDLFPSDLLERLEVVKALTPAMEADAIGGSMNLVMKTAPNKFMFNVHAAGGYNTLFSERPFQAFNQKYISRQDPAEKFGPGYVATDADFSRGNLSSRKLDNPVNGQIGLTMADRFLNKKLGAILGISFQNSYRGSNSVFNQQEKAPTYRRNLGGISGNNYDNSAAFGDSYIREYSTQQRRLGINNKFDYVFNTNNKISLFNLYVHMDDFQNRYSIDSVLGPNKGNVKEFYRTRWQIQSIYNSTLQGDHTLSDLVKVNWSAVYSYARQSVPDQAEYEVDNSIKVSPKVYTLNDLTRKWQHNSDQDLAGYLNFVYTPTFYKTKVEFSAGGLFRHKTRENYYNEYSLNPKGSAPVFTNINDAQYSFKSGGGIGTPGNGNDYSVTENTSAGYLQAKLMATKKLQLLGGVRVEHTDQQYNTALSLNTDAAYGHIWYTDVLPSMHLKYLLSDKENLRLSYFRSLVRPGFFEITPYYVQSEYYYEQGNPYLKHTTADNIDVRYELFPNGADQVLAGVFYKNIHNPIEIVFPERVVAGQNIALKPDNLGDAKNFGFELVVTKYIGKFGVNANYTYTHSAITTNKYYLSYDTASGRPSTKIVSQTRPLQGQAEHIGNLSLLFKDSKSGLDVQLAFVYTGERIVQVAQYADLDSWQKPYSQLDFSFEKKIVKHFSFYGKINNLTNSKTNVVLKQPYVLAQGTGALDQIAGQSDYRNTFIQSDLYKLSFLFGLRYKL